VARVSANPQHLTLPVRIGADGTFATLSQNTPPEVAQCVRVLLGTVKGTRTTLPAYGVPDLTFSTKIGPNAELEGAVARWEPRAAGARVAVAIDATGTATVRVTLPEARR
jgi:phage baseplate assembly protein W